MNRLYIMILSDLLILHDLYTYIHTCIHTFIYSYIHRYIHSFIHTYIHIYSYIHTYIHTGPHLVRLYYQLMGASIGRNVTIHKDAKLGQADLLTIGEAT